MRQSVTTKSRPVRRAQAKTASPSRRPAPEPRWSGRTEAKPRKPGARREREAPVCRGHLDRARDRGAEHLSVALDDEGREARVFEVLLVLRAGRLEARQRKP